jgi:phosphoribosylformylglycinamidine synthase
MASAGEVGIDLDVARVPLREADMAPFEIMVSESQERMLCVAEPARVEEVLAVCAKWEVLGTVIGEVTEGRQMRILRDGEVVGEVPVQALVDDCPLYDLAPEPPAGQLYPAPRATLAAGASVRETLLALLASPNIASRRPLFEQYDCLVGARTARRPEQADAAVLALPGGGGIAVSIDGSGRRVAADPYRGTIEVVLECAANLACVGAEPLGLTNCLNFGNPEKPHIAWQLTESVRGLGDVCRALGVPVVGGNVSLYNEGADGPIYPTPVVGLVGELPDPAAAGRLGFRSEGDAIAVVGPFAPALAASELAKLRGDALPEALPELDVASIRAAQEAVRAAVRAGTVASAHDIAEGGALVAIAECCLEGGLGATVQLGEGEAARFGEGPGGFVLSGPEAALRSLPGARLIGSVGGEELAAGGDRWALGELREAHAALARLFP